MSANPPLKILCLLPISPFPVRGGWQVVIYNDMKYLKERGHEITALAWQYQPDDDPQDVADVAKVEYFHKHKLPRWRQVLANIGSALPYTIARQHDDRFLARARELAASGEFDVVLVEDVVMGDYAKLLKETTPIPTFLRSHNISTTIVQRYYQSQRNPILRFLGWRQFVKFERFESAVFETFDRVSQITPVDVAKAQEMNPRYPQQLLYSGVDLDYLTYGPPEEREPDTILQLGGGQALTALPGLIWFCEQVLPRIRAHRPETKLELVGDIPKDFMEVIPDNVILRGFVDDIRPYLHKGAVFISPMFVGSGIRIRILNAMATGNAIVATPMAAEGLPVEHERDIMITEDAARFAQHVCTLLDDPARRAGLGRRARATMEARFGWPRIAEELEVHLYEAIKHHHANR